MFEKIQKLICQQFGLDQERVTEQSRFVEDLCCDSLDVIDLMNAAEEAFGMGEIPEEALGQMKTVGDLVKYVKSNGQEG